MWFLVFLVLVFLVFLETNTGKLACSRRWSLKNFLSIGMCLTQSLQKFVTVLFLLLSVGFLSLVVSFLLLFTKFV